MPYFISNDALPHLELKALLRGWAGRYTPFDRVRERIVLRTICIAVGDPDFQGGPSMKEELFSLLRQVAGEELGLAERYQEEGTDADSQRGAVADT